MILRLRVKKNVAKQNIVKETIAKKPLTITGNITYRLTSVHMRFRHGRDHHQAPCEAVLDVIQTGV